MTVEGSLLEALEFRAVMYADSVQFHHQRDADAAGKLDYRPRDSPK